MSAISTVQKPTSSERSVQRTFLMPAVLFLTVVIGLGLVLPLVHILKPSAGTITANELAGMLAGICGGLLCFIVLLQGNILDLQRRIVELEKIVSPSRAD